MNKFTKVSKEVRSKCSMYFTVCIENITANINYVNLYKFS